MLTKTIHSQSTDTSNHTSPAKQLTKAVQWVRYALQIRRERQSLAALDERILKDIGLSKSMAFRESTRGFFDTPEVGRKTKTQAHVRRFRSRDLG
ncbi:MAG: DUF1127 domain-containing protein [Pseudomonadota bacterium]